jgi:hypothetical protein
MPLCSGVSRSIVIINNEEIIISQPIDTSTNLWLGNVYLFNNPDTSIFLFAED